MQDGRPFGHTGWFDEVHKGPYTDWRMKEDFYIQVQEMNIFMKLASCFIKANAIKK